MSVKQQREGLGLEALVGLLAVGEGDDVVSGLFERAHKEAAHELVVLGQQNADHGHTGGLSGHTRILCTRVALVGDPFATTVVSAW